MLGEVNSFQSMLGNVRPEVQIMDPGQGGKVVETRTKDTPDNIFIQGRFASGALFSYHIRGGEPFAGTPGVDFRIYGEKGEIRITNPVSVMDISHDGVQIKLQIFGKGGTENIELPKDALSDLPHPAQNVGREYEAYAAGNAGGDDGYPDWEVAMIRHRLMDDMFEKSKDFSVFGEPVPKV